MNVKTWQYCTEEHLKLHRPENLCFPFRVEQKEGVGRYLVATRDIQPMGERNYTGLKVLLGSKVLHSLPFLPLSSPESKFQNKHAQNLSCQNILRRCIQYLCTYMIIFHTNNRLQRSHPNLRLHFT